MYLDQLAISSIDIISDAWPIIWLLLSCITTVISANFSDFVIIAKLCLRNILSAFLLMLLCCGEFVLLCCGEFGANRQN